MQNEFDIDRARRDTKACGDLVHFNNAGSSLMPIPVADTLRAFLNQEEMSGGYETAEAQASALDNFYGATARLLNCKPTEVAFVENATRAWDMAFYSFRFSAGDKILTTLAEYGSNVIAYNQQVARYGVELVFVDNDEHGQIDVNALENLIDDRVKLISITHIPTGGGLINPACAVGKIANAAGVPYLLDSCQGMGHIDLDVEQLGCDMLCGTGRKYLRGPRATGMLYVKKRFIKELEPYVLDQHAAELVSPTTYTIREDAGRFENWEQFYAGKAALGTAIDYAMTYGMPAIQHRVISLGEELRNKLVDIDGVVLTDEGLEKCGIVTFKTAQQTATNIKKQLRTKQINVSVSAGSGSLVSFQQRGLVEVVRASVHYYNTSQEIDYFIASLRQVLG